jgi:adenylate cyclase
MALEIERKYLINPDLLPSLPQGTRLVQGYIPRDGGVTVRIRIAQEQASLTIKGTTSGITRLEFEYPIALSDAQSMLELFCARPLIEKVRYRIPHEDHIWELDVFEGQNRGLIIAEIELQSETESFALPRWVTRDVSHDHRYRNANLMLHPYSSW